MYDEILLEHNLHPRFQGRIPGVEPITLVNAGCGDELKVFLKIKNGRVLDGRFSGNGCAISKASADLFIAAIKGKDLRMVGEIKEIFEKMIVGEATEKQIERIGDLAALKSVSRMPARAKCAKLAWESLDKMTVEDLKNAYA